ncbi:MAG: hypothetical protein QM820_55785 [Minicystis sp.]
MRRTPITTGHARSRRGRRGAALIEAVVAIPFFILVFAVTMFIGKFYGEKLRTMRLSRECAWAHAMAGCKGGCGSAETGPAAGEPLAPAEAQDPATQGAPGAEVMSQSWYQSKFTVKSSATASNVIGGYTKSVQSTTITMCDEEPEDGTITGVVKYVWNNASGL